MLRIDLRKSITSLAILQIEARLQELSPEAEMEIISDDDRLMQDLRRVRKDCECERKGDYYDGIEEGFLFVVRKKHTTKEQRHG